MTTVRRSTPNLPPSHPEAVDRGELRAQALERDKRCVWCKAIDAETDCSPVLEMAHAHGIGMGGRNSADTLDNTIILDQHCHAMLDGRRAMEVQWVATLFDTSLREHQSRQNPRGSTRQPADTSSGDGRSGAVSTSKPTSTESAMDASSLMPTSITSMATRQTTAPKTSSDSHRPNTEPRTEQPIGRFIPSKNGLSDTAPESPPPRLVLPMVSTGQPSLDTSNDAESPIEIRDGVDGYPLTRTRSSNCGWPGCDLPPSVSCSAVVERRSTEGSVRQAFPLSQPAHLCQWHHDLLDGRNMSGKRAEIAGLLLNIIRSSRSVWPTSPAVPD